MTASHQEPLDCVIVGGGPAGLTAAIYLARFRRRFLLVDSGIGRATRIPISRNMPGYPQGIDGGTLVNRMTLQAQKFGTIVERGTVRDLRETNKIFELRLENRLIHARTVLLATGTVDADPPTLNVPSLIANGLLRYCPICDGYEVRDYRIGVIGADEHAVRESQFLRSYSEDISLLTMGTGDVSQDTAKQLARSGITLISERVEISATGQGVYVTERRTDVIHTFDTLYVALGSKPQSMLGTGVGAVVDSEGSLVVDANNQTTVPGLYAAGDVTAGLNQISVAMGQAAVSATAIHNQLSTA